MVQYMYMAVHPGRALTDVFEPSEPADFNKFAELQIDYNLFEELLKKTGLSKIKLSNVLDDIKSAGAVKSTDWGDGTVAFNIFDPSSLEKIPDQFVDSFVTWSTVDKAAKDAIWNTLFQSEHSDLRMSERDSVTGQIVATGVGMTIVGQGWGALAAGARANISGGLGLKYEDMQEHMKLFLSDKVGGKEAYGDFQDTWLDLYDTTCKKYGVNPLDDTGAAVSLDVHLDPTTGAISTAKDELKTAKVALKTAEEDTFAIVRQVNAKDAITDKTKLLGTARKDAWAATARKDALGSTRAGVGPHFFAGRLPVDAQNEFKRLGMLRRIGENWKTQRTLEEKFAGFGIAKSYYTDGLTVKNLKATWNWLGKLLPGYVGAFQTFIKQSGRPLAILSRKITRTLGLPKALSVRALKSINYFGFSGEFFKNRALLHGKDAVTAITKLGRGVGKFGKVGLGDLQALAGGAGGEITYLQHLYNFGNGIGAPPIGITGAITRAEARALSGQFGSAFFGKKGWKIARTAFRKAPNGTLLTGSGLAKVNKAFKKKISVLDLLAKAKGRLGAAGTAVVNKAKAAIRRKLIKLGLEQVASKGIALLLAPETLGLSIVVERLLKWVILPLIKFLFNYIWTKLFKGIWDATFGKVLKALKGNKLVKGVVKSVAITMLTPIIAVIGAAVALPIASILIALGGCLFGTIGLALLVFVVIIGASSGLPTPLGQGGSDYFAQIPPPEQAGYIPPAGGPIVVTVTPTPSIVEEDSGTITYVVVVANNTEEAVIVDVEDEAFLVTATDVVIASGGSVYLPGWGSFANVPTDYVSSCPELGVDKFCNKVVVTLSDGESVIGWGMGQVLFNSALADYPSGWPLTTRHCITTGTNTPRFHINASAQSVDFAGDPTANVIATHNGVVSVTSYSSIGYGNLVILEALDGGFKSYYAHLVVISVSAGDIVTAGTVLGVEGDTGNSTGTHLHYEFRGGGLFMGPPYLPWAVPPCSGYAISSDPGYASCLSVLGVNACIN